MFYFIYKTTNLINGKIYVGTHKTNNIDDGYLGSGKILLRAINKHGLENFKREIIMNFDSAEDMFNMEAQLVNEAFVQDPNTYNIKKGGFGGWDHVIGKGLGFTGKSHTNVAKEKISKSRIGVGPSQETRIKISLAQLGKPKPGVSAKLKARKKEMPTTMATKKKISDSLKKHFSLEQNRIKHGLSRIGKTYGYKWMFNDKLKQSKYVHSSKIHSKENEGWILGRKMKF